MKECAICGEQLDDHALKCSKGHSVFKLQPGKQVYSDEPKIVADMLRQSSVGYTEEEISFLVHEILQIFRASRTPVTNEQLKSIKNSIEQKHKERKAIELKESEAERERAQRESIERQPNSTRVSREHELRHSDQRSRNIEEAMPVFRGRSERDLHSRELGPLVAEAIDPSLYTRLLPPQLKIQSDRTYEDNENFWKDALNNTLIHGMMIGLSGFHLTEWVPSAPGRYFTSEATDARNEAERYVNHQRREYLPIGKQFMVLGGVGSIRLAERSIGGSDAHPLCASASGISHQGIPVILRESEYRKVMRSLSESGGCLVNLVGHLKIVPKEQIPINFDGQIRRYFLFVDDLELLGPSIKLISTVAITFSYNGRIGDKLWSFCSFDPAQQDVKAAVNWLNDYALRYSHAPQPLILSDFDEHFQHFNNQIEFPLSAVGRGQFDFVRLAQYAHELPIIINRGVINMDIQDFRGANINNIGGQQFIGKFNNTIASLNATGNEELGNALAELTKAVATSNHLSDDQKRESLEVVQQLGDAAAKPQPNKSLIKSLGDGLITALKTVPDVAKAVTALAPFIEKLVT